MRRSAGDLTQRSAGRRAEDSREGFSLSAGLGLGVRELVSLSGAGGKTSLMFRLAAELLREGKRVVTTTTTRILEPMAGETGRLHIESDVSGVEAFLRSHLPQERHITIASESMGEKKLKGFPAAMLDRLWRWGGIDFLIVEADGAACRAIKAPRAWEPVFPLETTVAVGVLGVDGAGAPLNETNAFQPGLISSLTGIPMGAPMTEEGMAVLVVHRGGVFKDAPAGSRLVAFLNKVDLSGGVEKAEEIAERIVGQNPPNLERIVWGQVRKDPPVVGWRFVSP